MTIFFTLLAAILIIAQLVIFGLAISSMIKFSKATEFTEKSVRKTTLFAIIGFGPLIGSILYFTMIAPKITQNKEAKSAGIIGVIVGALISIVANTILGISLSMAFFGAITSNINNAKPYMPKDNPIVGENKSLQEAEKDIKEKTGDETATLRFKAKFPCALVESETASIAGVASKVKGCFKGNTPTFLMYAPLPEEFDINQKDTVIKAAKDKLNEDLNEVISQEDTVIAGQPGIFTIGRGNDRIVAHALFFDQNPEGKWEFWQVFSVSEGHATPEQARQKFDDFAKTLSLN